MQVTQTSSLYRHDNTLYGYTIPDNPGGLREVRISAKPPKDGSDALQCAIDTHRVAKEIMNLLGAANTAEAVELKLKEITDANLLVGWNLSIVKPKSGFLSKILSSEPMLHKINDRRVCVISTQPKTAESFAIWKASQEIKPKITLPGYYAIPTTVDAELLIKPFTDPFTTLAKDAFQTIEPNFVSGSSIKGALRFIVETKNIILNEFKVSLIPLRPEHQEIPEIAKQNRKAVKRFYDFAVSEYGIVHMKYVEGAYGINFRDMIEKGSPLTPDHIFKVNIGVNSFQFSHLELLRSKLGNLLKEKRIIDNDSTPQHAFTDLKAFGATPEVLSIREWRKIVQLFQKSKNDGRTSFKEFIQAIVGDEAISLDSLPASQVNALISILMPSDDELKQIYTGREIKHLAICGYSTMGSTDETDACRDTFELLHTFSDMKGGDWTNYYEMLGHVAAKKSLYHKYIVDGKPEWRVGALIPGPTDEATGEIWYQVESVSDDEMGNLNYMLLPVTDKYRTGGKLPPAIKLFRSTAMSAGSIDSIDSVVADLNPYGSPGDTDPTDTFSREKVYFDDRTIPLWVGYLLQGQSIRERGGELSDAYKAFQKGVEELVYCMKNDGSYDDLIMDPVDVKDILLTAKAQLRHEVLEEMEQFLISVAEQTKEHPKYKKAQDITAAGHSLGASLSQRAMYDFITLRRRVMLPGCTFTCVTSDPPGIGTAKDKAFIAYGRDAAALMKELGQKMRIVHRFEKGDIVSQGGESHLGTNGYAKDKDDSWLEIDISVFSPLETSEALAITTMPTHGRRFGRTIADIDHRVAKVTAEELYRLKHTIIVPKSIQETFGSSRVLRSPVVTDFIRRMVGRVVSPILRVVELVTERIQNTPGEPGSGIFYATKDKPHRVGDTL